MPIGGQDTAGAGVLEVRDDGTFVLRFERHLAHPPEKVWGALTEPEQLRQWFPTEIEGEREQGARLRFVFRDDAPRAADMPALLANDPEDLDGEFTEFDPPRLLAYRWGDEHLRWELERTSAGCTLVFVHTFDEHSGIAHPAGPRKKAARTAAGWDISLASLEASLGAGKAPAPEWETLYGGYVEQFG